MTTDPYHTLGVDPQASDETIRAAYLKAIRAHTPEGDPEGFRAIARAYDAIKDEEARIRWLLEVHDVEADSPRDLLKAYAMSRRQGPMDFETMKAFLRSLA